MVRIYCKKNFRTHDDKEFSTGFFYDDSSYAREMIAAGYGIIEEDYVVEQAAEAIEKEHQQELVKKRAEKSRIGRAREDVSTAQARLDECLRVLFGLEKAASDEAEAKAREEESMTFNVDLDKLLEAESPMLITEVVELSSAENKTGPSSDEVLEGDK